jgi:rSAM/selenodomain-associated transferase 1
MNVLGIFAKHPQPGRVKTRLAADVGPDAAAALYAAFVADLLERFRDVGERRIIGYAPAESAAREYFHAQADAYELWPQPEADLGDRIAAFFDHAFASGGERVVLIGSDSPTLPAGHVQAAFAALHDHDCAIGPATDGGYYLIALRSPCRELFAGISWGGPDVLRQTVERVAESRLSLALGPVWYDVDAVCDLQFLSGHLAALHAAGEANVAPRTARALSSLCEFRRGSLLNNPVEIALYQIGG